MYLSDTQYLNPDEIFKSDGQTQNLEFIQYNATLLLVPICILPTVRLILLVDAITLPDRRKNNTFGFV